ncbi:Uncharacterised protein [Vibrio cholerae]|nr:Uncharacterised protein [Vibrio cholerae]
MVAPTIPMLNTDVAELSRYKAAVLCTVSSKVRMKFR